MMGYMAVILEKDLKRGHDALVQWRAAARELADKGIRPDVIVVDPPRKGLSPDVIQAIGEMAPQRLVYVSCDPATLSRDVKEVSALGYGLRSVQAVDMFPRTSHVETVVSLQKTNQPG